MQHRSKNKIPRETEPIVTMARINAITGLKRKLSRYETPRKKRETACSTVASRMYGQQAMEAFISYLTGCYQALILMVISIDRNDIQLVRLFTVIGSFFFSAAVCCARLESELLDFYNDEDDVGFAKPLAHISPSSSNNLVKYRSFPPENRRYFLYSS